jgi:hypothetical protein
LFFGLIQTTNHFADRRIEGVDRAVTEICHNQIVSQRPERGGASGRPTVNSTRRSNIRPGDAAILDEVAETLKSNTNVTVYVDGCCDAIGSEQYNLKLSQRRSEAVLVISSATASTLRG